MPSASHNSTRTEADPAASAAPGANSAGTTSAKAAPRTFVVAGNATTSSDTGTIAALQLILKIERDARHAGNIGELIHLSANETRRVVSARQVFVGRVKKSADFEISGISSLPSVDPNSPAVLWMQRLASRMAKEAGGWNSSRQFTLPAYCDGTDPETKSYPFREIVFVPLKNRKGETFAALFLTRENAWLDSDIAVVTRLADTYAHAWQALESRNGFDLRAVANRKTTRVAAVALVLLALLPVPLTALAPVEVVSDAPHVVAAPVEGVIDEVVVAPSAHVKLGDILLRFNDTTARNALEVAERELAVAEAKLRQFTQAAFGDPSAKRELSISEAETALKRAERDYARDVLQKSVIRANREGIAIYADRRELVGRPVVVGQRIMEIADPTRISFRISVPVDDAVVLEPSSKVRVFLDSDPLNPLAGRIVRSSHSARLSDSNQLAFRVEAAPELGTAPVPRLGLRGTAQLYGPRVALGYYLFRRPITFVRQKLGI